MTYNNVILITWTSGYIVNKTNENGDKVAKQEVKSDSQPESENGMPYQQGCNFIKEIMDDERWITCLYLDLKVDLVYLK